MDKTIRGPLRDIFRFVLVDFVLLFVSGAFSGQQHHFIIKNIRIISSNTAIRLVGFGEVFVRLCQRFNTFRLDFASFCELLSRFR